LSRLSLISLLLTVNRGLVDSSLFWIEEFPSYLSSLSLWLVLPSLFFRTSESELLLFLSLALEMLLALRLFSFFFSSKRL